MKKKLMLGNGVIVLTRSAQRNGRMVTITDPSAELQFPRAVDDLSEAELRACYDTQNPNEMAWLEI